MSVHSGANREDNQDQRRPKVLSSTSEPTVAFTESRKVQDPLNRGGSAPAAATQSESGNSLKSPSSYQPQDSGYSSPSVSALSSAAHRISSNHQPSIAEQRLAGSDVLGARGGVTGGCKKEEDDESQVARNLRAENEMPSYDAAWYELEDRMDTSE